MSFIVSTLWALWVKSFLILFFIINVNGIPTNDQCTAQIDNKISSFSPETRKRAVTITSIEPCPTCVIYGFLDVERDPNYPIEIQEVDGGIKYSVVILLKNFTRVCHCRVRATVDGVVDLFYSTLFDNPALKNCDPDGTVNIVKNSANVDVPGLIPAPNKALALLTRAPSVQEATDIIIKLALQFVTTYQIDLYLNGQAEGILNNYTIFVDSNGNGKIIEYKYPLKVPKSYKNWCEGSRNNVGLRKLCTCLLQTNVGLSTFIKVINIFLPCYTNSNEGYRQIIFAITCI